MADWSALRARAYERHLKLRGHIDTKTQPIIHADALLEAAEEATGYAIQSLAEGDPLLAGAQAFLDRDSEMIWYAAGDGLSPERQRFAQAHEFAHLWLHADFLTDHSLPDDTPAAYAGAAPSLASQIEEGYSPRERREREANLFAAELLLPSPLLRHAYHNLGLRADRTATLSGLSETCVLTQLAYALLVPTKDRPQTRPGQTAVQSIVDLDPSQEQAARVPAGPVLIDAGPGTGKTRTLTARIVHLLRDRKVVPENILALTFSNHAAEEMTDRLLAAVGETAHRAWIGTFHAFGFELLRKEGHRIGLPAYPELLETADAMLLLERNLDLLDLHEYEYLSSPTLPFPDILSAISRAKDELKTPEDYERAARQMADAAQTDAERTEAAKAVEVARVYGVYQNLLRAHGLVDYGDLIARSVELLEAFPDVRERWQRQYPHILADEYQDVNRATARLLQLLAGDGKGFWAVGDLRQAIYRFRGASPANIRRFEHDFPGGFRLSLDYNYRSRPGLVRVFGGMAREMVSGAGGQDGWSAFRLDGSGPQLTLAVPTNESSQAQWLADQIRMRESQGVPRHEQAILVPTNRHAAELAELLEQNGVSVQYSGSLFDREEIKDLIALLSLASEPEGLGLMRVAQFDEIRIPAADAKLVIEAAREAGHSFPGALKWALENVPVSEAGRKGLARLCETLLSIAYRGDSWSLLARYLLNTSEYLAPLFADDNAANQQKRLAIYQLLLAVQQMTDRLPPEQRERPRIALLNRLRRLLQLRQSRSVRIPDTGAAIDGVRIMTIHQSKGLEFQVVYLPNLIKGQFPARGRGAMATFPVALAEEADHEDGGEEEMFFVALSRARDELVLSRPATWRGKTTEPAPILQRIAAALTGEGAAWTLVTAETVSGIVEGNTSADTPIEEDIADAADPVPERPEISLSRLRQYQTCPRQYYYRHVLDLPERDEDGAYRTFHRHLQDTLEWLQAERSAGRSPSAADARAMLRAKWPESPQSETALTRILRKRAGLLLDSAQTHFAPQSEGTAQEEFNAELESGTVKLRGDEVKRSEDGTVRITQHLHRRPKKDDHTAEPLALIRMAAKQRSPDKPVEIALFSTATGETREVKEDRRWEPKRIEKYDVALRDLAAGRFPARPSDTQCASCPFFFICPA
jgi:superfamily I DNA/RNA helicase/Zn-dependent peptidase ImmA (M78 family)/CRISPR/Cas system-associated exonuclease Cas4 (RecB family)